VYPKLCLQRLGDRDRRIGRAHRPGRQQVLAHSVALHWQRFDDRGVRPIRVRDQALAEKVAFEFEDDVSRRIKTRQHIAILKDPAIRSVVNDLVTLTIL